MRRVKRALSRWNQGLYGVACDRSTHRKIARSCGNGCALCCKARIAVRQAPAPGTGGDAPDISLHEEHAMFKRIIVAIDGSRTSQHAFDAALDLAVTHQAVVQPYYVVESGPMYMDVPGYD